MMKNLFNTLEQKIDNKQIDRLGHMCIQWYTSYFDQAMWSLFNQLGITSEYMEEQNKGMVVVHQVTDFKIEVLEGSSISIKTELLDVSPRKIGFAHHMFDNNSDKEIAVCGMTCVHFDLTERKSCDLPREVVEKIQMILS